MALSLPLKCSQLLPEFKEKCGEFFFSVSFYSSKMAHLIGEGSRVSDISCLNA